MPQAQPAAMPVAVITGASEGIGRAIAARLARDGWLPALVGRDAQRLAAHEIAPHARAFAADLAEPDAADRLVAAVAAQLGRIDLVVHCASATRFGALLDIPDAQWVEGFAVKVHGAIRLLRAAWPHLQEAGGSAVLIGGIGARTPRAATAMSGPLSAALQAVTKLFADQGVSDGVRVNQINPGPVLTPRLAAMLDEQAAREGGTRNQQISAMIRGAGAMRIGMPDDVAELVGYLSSDAARLLHGAIIDLDGGITRGL